MKIVVVGLGYVGLSNAVLLAQHNEVIGVDISQERVDALNARKSSIIDTELSRYLDEKDLTLSASTDLAASVKGADYVIVSTPTNYDEETHFFDTTSVEEVISQVIEHEPQACIVIKSTIPIGFTDNIRVRLGTEAVMFSPEFLREGKALDDNLFPSRIIVGEETDRARVFANLLAQGAKKSDIDLLFTGAREAEAIKLFSNTYLAMRVAFFNELDSYALAYGLNSKNLVTGVSMDPRIGNYYNNPSFGYGGYCLPKDTKQLLANYRDVPQDIIRAIIDSNSTRKQFIIQKILENEPGVVGIYKLQMKADSDNSRNSAILEIIETLKNKRVEVIIYEPTYDAKYFYNSQVIRDLNHFKNTADLILTNRKCAELSDIASKVFTRDLFGTD